MSSGSFFDSVGRSIVLRKSLGRGGEGEVFALAGSTRQVAKIYHDPPDRDHAEKLAVMAALPAHDLLKVAAWPVETLHRKRGGPVAGLVMPLVENHRELHVLYSPAQRRQSFPKAGWDFLVHVAANMARAFATVHSAGHVIGDVNQKNVVVSMDGMVRLIDCDSFQINSKGKHFLCKVGVPDFTPPELHGGSFSKVVRTPDHDHFGLAVLIFHLLFMGRHPFVGVYKGGREDMPMEKAIREGRYAYGNAALRFGMAPPPYSVAPAAVAPPLLATMFEQAFATPGGQGRPSSEAWVHTLGELRKSLRKCPSHPGHIYAGGACPWCAIERTGGPDFFITLAAQTYAGAAFDLSALLRQASQIRAPASPLPPALLNPPRPAAVAAVRTRNDTSATAAVLLYALAGVCGLAILGGAGWFVLGCVFFILAGNHARSRAEDSDLANELREIASRTSQAHEAKKKEYARSVDDLATRYRVAAEELKKKAQRYQNLAGEHQRAKQDLITQQRKHQLIHHMERYYLRDATIDGVGPQLKQKLLAFGIETAADITRGAVSGVSGFGPTRIAALLAWRGAVESRFVFNPNKGVDPADVAAIDRKFALIRRDLEGQLATAVSDLQSLSNRSHAASERLLPEIWETAHQVAIARARAGIS